MMSDSEEDSSGGTDWPVTEEWLQAVLRKHHDTLEDPSAITVADFTVRPGCDAGESVLSDILAVAVKYRLPDDAADEDKTHSLSFVIKLLPQDPFSRFFVTEAQFDLREIKFYTQVSGEGNLHTRKLQTSNNKVKKQFQKIMLTSGTCL